MLLTVLSILVLGGVSGLEDFSYLHNEYEFVYHDDHDLLLTIHNDTCYYSWVPDGEGEDRVLSNRMNFVEHQVRIAIYHRQTSPRVQKSSLDDVRKEFSDLLADFRCADKNIYTIWIKAVDMNRTHQPTHAPFSHRPRITHTTRKHVTQSHVTPTTRQHVDTQTTPRHHDTRHHVTNSRISHTTRHPHPHPTPTRHPQRHPPPPRGQHPPPRRHPNAPPPRRHDRPHDSHEQDRD